MKEHTPRAPTLLIVGEAQDECKKALSALPEVALRIATPDAATELVEKSPDLALVVIDGSIGESTGAPIVRTLRALDPGLRVVWVGLKAASIGMFGADPPDRVLTLPAEPEAVRRVISELLMLDVYRPPVVHALSKATIHTLAQGFHSSADTCDYFIKANSLTLAPTNALLPFSGPKLAGWCLVSGENQALAGIRKRTVPSDTRTTAADLEDVAGEIANHIVSTLRRWFSSQGIDLTSGYPIVMHGRDYKIREVRGQMSLVARPHLEDLGLFVQLCLDTRNKLDLEDAFPEDLLTPPAIEFLNLQPRGSGNG